ncbi:MAG: glutathione S-transferase [Sphingomonas bacterium]|uniref:glutathione S-transferase N-terminal domain-containing protein n=1 Tax=Sphingomonas bacterium TaxID=1895847 RepID=UPI0026283E5B|nr:glutathione S-transferase N-terminal domain-containing protein [Sphingomonas bacterium]MDB5709334.1 glutathione S-transferase [Sphingomonas bacterium]
MKLYYAPGACSLADHIALHEAGLSFDHEKVDLKAKKTESGADFTAINPKRYVPALTLDSGETLSENIAILEWITQQAPQLAPGGAMGRTHLLEMLAYISTEIHKSFKPFFAGASDEDKDKAGAMITKRMGYLAERLDGDYLFGADVSVADAYLFVMTLWAGKMGVSVPDKVAALRDRMMARPAVRTAMTHEGLIKA